jgi:hypothetical protein
VTLLAILELARLKVVRVLQDQETGNFFIARREGASLDDARQVQPTSGGASEEEAAAAAPAESAGSNPEEPDGAT